MMDPSQRTRAQESRAAIERLYIIIRHLFNRGSYKPFGVSGEALRNALLILRPEIYGSIAENERVELNGLLYVIERLPKGIEECRIVRLISVEGYSESNFDVIVPPKRKRNCYRIDQEQMFVELTRGRSDIYDILTHLTFMYIESEKIRQNALDAKGHTRRDWLKLEELALNELKGEEINEEIAYTYLSPILGRTYEETAEIYQKFAKNRLSNNSLLHITYWLGKVAIDEFKNGKDREIFFSAALRERVGHHIHGEKWAKIIKNYLLDNELIERPIHIISANMHSVMNCLYSQGAIKNSTKVTSVEETARTLSLSENDYLREKVTQYASRNGLFRIDDNNGTNISVQIIDTTQIDLKQVWKDVEINPELIEKEQPVLLVMDYPFGEQGFETLDELLKPLEIEEQDIPLNVKSISIMGKAGILNGKKGDIMVPTAHVFEGTADNYPIENDLDEKDFKSSGLDVFVGPMITVLGTSLQNKDVLNYFVASSWNAIGLEMEGAHLQKAIQAAAKIRKSIDENVIIRYAYYASDNPLVTGHTLASGSLGLDGVKPTYLITTKILNKILSPE